MKKILVKILRIGIVIVLLGTCLLISLRLIFGLPNREAREYLNRTIPAVVKNWDLNNLRQYSGKCLLEDLNGGYKKDFESLFASCAKNLGSLKTLGDSQIDFDGKMCGKSGCTDIYKCATPAVFEKGKAKIFTSVYLSGDQGRIESFEVRFVDYP